MLVKTLANAMQSQHLTTGRHPPLSEVNMRTFPFLREVNMLRKRDEGKGAIDFVNIADKSYNPAENMGIDYKQVGCRGCGRYR